MKAKFAELLYIDNDQTIDRNTHDELWRYLEQGLLLALRERGSINLMQYHLAMELLKQDQLERPRKRMEGTS